MLKLVTTAFASLFIAACGEQSTAPTPSSTSAPAATPPAQVTPAPAPAPASVVAIVDVPEIAGKAQTRSEEHTSELQSLMRSSYAVFCLKKKKNTNTHKQHIN